MNTTTLVVAYRNWLNATATMQGELQTALRGGTLSAATVAELAEAHAEHYGCYLLEKDGAWRFYTSDEAVSANRHEAAQRQWDRRFSSAVAAMLTGTVIIYVLGLAWLKQDQGLDLATTSEYGLYPFVPGDLLKLYLAGALLPGAWRLVRRFRGEG